MENNQPAPQGEDGLPPVPPYHWLPLPQPQLHQLQLPPGFPWWQPPQQFQQHQQAPKISLTPFRHADSAAWFWLAEATFNPYNVHDVHLQFNFILPRLRSRAGRAGSHAADEVAPSVHTRL